MSGDDPIGAGRRKPVMGAAKVRVELAAFAEACEAKLQANDHKAHWSEIPVPQLCFRLAEEVVELSAAIRRVEKLHEIQLEACDVANFAMMIWDAVERMKGAAE